MTKPNKNQQPPVVLNVSPAQADSTLSKKKKYVPGFDVGIQLQRIGELTKGARFIE